MTDQTKIPRDSPKLGSQAGASVGGIQPEHRSLWEKLRRFLPRNTLSPGQERLSKLTPQIRAQLLYEYCISSDKKVSESVHSLFIIAEHYSAEKPDDLDQPELINGIPPFFANLKAAEKAEYCYNQVTEALSLQAMPVTVESLRATKRRNPDDPWSSYAGQFVWHVTWWVVAALVAMLIAYFTLFFEQPAFLETPEGKAIQWIAFGCIGALVHLLNHALTTTRLQTFEVSEARKIGPRLLLGGIFGYVVPWILIKADVVPDNAIAVAQVAAFFGGYSVRFSVGFIERLMEALLPDTKPKS